MQLRFRLWLVAMLVLSLAFLLLVRPQLRIDTDLLGLLPAAEQDVGANQALRSWSDNLGRRALFLIGAPDHAQARAAAAKFAQTLRASDAFAQVQLEVGSEAGGLGSLYAPHRAGLLAPRHRQWLATDQNEQLYTEALHALYAPSVTPRPLAVSEDPLNLLGGFLAQSVTPPGAARWREGVLSVDSGGHSDVLVSVELRDSPFATDTQERAMPAIEAALAQARATPGVEVHTSGLILHAAEATRSAQREIGTVGTLSLVGVILMVLLTFRSPRPLLLSALVLGSGALAAVTVCHLLFGRLHLLTLVFGVGLIGVAVDYSNHFLTDQFRTQGDWRPPQALHHVGPGIVIGMICGVLGYTALALAPLPGLRQMAVFCAIGLIVACATVLCVHPLFARPAPRRDAPLLLRLSVMVDRALDRLPGKPWLLATLVLLGAVGLWRLQFADDVRLLQSSSPALLAEEKAVRDRLQSLPDSRVFLVRGATPAAVLEAEESLRRQLDPLVAQDALSSYLALSRALPSPRQQAEDRALMARSVYAEDGLAPRLLAQLGFEPAVAQRMRASFDAATAPLSPEAWLAHPASAAQRTLWLGPIDEGYASVIALIGVRDVAALAALQSPGAQFIDRVADISEVLGRYRERASMLIACAWLLIGSLLVMRYGLRDAVRLLAVPLGAALLTLALFGLLGISASLFNVLALFLVLGLGMDYGVFLRESRDARAPTLLALALSTLGTMLSYGLLAFSATPFIRSLGLTLTVGIGLTWLFALLSQRPARDPPSAPPA